MIRNTLQCKKCGDNEFYNGIECACLIGYGRDTTGVCAKKNLIPSCGPNEDYDNLYKMCLCKQNYNRVNGECQFSVTCGLNSYWNGVRCECNTGFINYNNQCLFVTTSTPICPENAHFNGVACVCDDKFYEVSRFNCQRCPDEQIWDGSRCNLNTTCPSGYVYNTQKNQCDPKAITCGPNSVWNGALCVCNEGYHSLNGNCIKCASNTAWDGKSCNPQVPANTCGSNQILINNVCVCQDGFNNIDGVCLQCPTGTTWNGKYCYSESSSNWCMGQPNTQASSWTCPCMAGFVKLEGCCLSHWNVIYPSFIFISHLQSINLLKVFK